MADAFEPDSLQRFRESSKAGRNLAAAANIAKPAKRRMKGLEIEFTSADRLRRAALAEN